MHTHKYTGAGNLLGWSLQMEVALDELRFGAEAENVIKKCGVAEPCVYHISIVVNNFLSFSHSLPQTFGTDILINFTATTLASQWRAGRSKH